MSRHLPPHPNLEYLKKQAKESLRDMRQRDPASKLADAQHAIARDYGFSSWPKLKAHVESLHTNPFVGAWIANLSKSKRRPDSPFNSATLHVDVIGDTVTITDVVVDASGREERHKNTLQADGKEHPSEYGGYLLLARWLSSHALEAVVKKNGEVEGRVTYEVSADSATLTILSDDQVFVCDRQ
jgi:hypothetical protein